MPIAPSRWVVPAPQHLVIHEWAGDPETLVFDERSGDVHLITPAAAELLRRATAEPIDLQTLAAGDQEAAVAILQSLDQLGLVRPAP